MKNNKKRRKMHQFNRIKIINRKIFKFYLFVNLKRLAKVEEYL